MFRLIGYFVVNALMLFCIDWISPGFSVASWWAALGYILVLTLLNWTIVPIIKLFALPINFLTFGLINFLINIVVIIITANIVEGVRIEGNVFSQIWIATLIAIGFSLAQGIVNRLTDDQ